MGAKSSDNSKYIRALILFALAGTALLALGLVGKTPFGVAVPLWRRLLYIAIGLFSFYVALIRLPKGRKEGLELRKELDEAEREMNLLEQPPKGVDPD